MDPLRAAQGVHAGSGGPLLGAYGENVAMPFDIGSRRDDWKKRLLDPWRSLKRKAKRIKAPAAGKQGCEHQEVYFIAQIIKFLRSARGLFLDAAKKGASRSGISQ